MFKKGLAVCLIITLAICGIGTPAQAQIGKVAMVWHYPNEAPLDRASNLDITSPNWFNLNEGDLTITDVGDDLGSANPNNSYNYIKTAHGKSMKVVPRLVGANYPGWSAASILGDASKRQTIITNLNAIIAKYKNNGTSLDGINLDFEAIGPSAIDGYTQFVKELGVALKAQGLQFSIDVPGCTSYTSPTSVWSGGYDFAALGQISQLDYIAIMAYDWGVGAPVYYVKDTLTYATQLIPRNKILLGVPLYSRDYLDYPTGPQTLWSSYYYTDAVNWFTNPGANATKTWDDTLGLTKVSYHRTGDNSDHVLYLEDARSLQVKLNLVNQFNIAGMAAWRFYNEDPAIWPAIGNNLGKIVGSRTDLWAKSKEVTGDFNGDGKKDIALFYDLGNNTVCIWAFLSNGNSFTPKLMWDSGPGNFSWERSKLVSGDFNGDGKDDISILYDYGNNTAAAWTLISDGDSLKDKQTWYSGKGNWSWERSQMVSGDFNGDKKTDVGVLYDYGNNTAGFWALLSDGSTLSDKRFWYSGLGNWSTARSKVTSGDFDGDGKTDIAVLYGYSNASTAAWILSSNGTSMQDKLAWYSGPGNFSWDRSKLASGDIDGDGKTDLAVLYGYGNTATSLWGLYSTGAAFKDKLLWYSGPGNFSWDRSKFYGGDVTGDGKSDFVVPYGYSNNTTGLWVFQSNGTSVSDKLFWKSGN